MTYKFNHVHIKANDPEAVANWYKGAFNFSIVSDTVRGFGDRFIRCQTEDGIVINISNERTGEKLPSGNDDPHWGIEHFGIEVDDDAVTISKEHCDFKWVSYESASKTLVWKGQKEGISAVHNMIISDDDRIKWSKVSL